MQFVQFTQMKDGTQEEYLMLKKKEQAFADGLCDRLLGLLKELDASLDGYQISRLEHCLQTATRAYRDGADEEMVVAALLHDIGDLHAPMNHAELAASILRPYVSERVCWIIEKHAIFQKYYYVHHYGGDRNQRRQFADHPWYDEALAFCENWDQASFDLKYDSQPVEFFLPMMQRLFTRDKSY